MKRYKVKISPRAKEDFKKSIYYLIYIKKNRQAAENLFSDYQNTREMLSNVAGSLREPDSEKLKDRRLKRMNFLKHDYFLLFRIDGDIVTVMNIFHSLEDFEEKLN